MMTLTIPRDNSGTSFEEPYDEQGENSPGNQIYRDDHDQVEYAEGEGTNDANVYDQDAVLREEKGRKAFL